MNDTYFIVSLPRSRTAWLSVLLTWQKSFCLHEASAGCEGCIADIFKNVPVGTKYFGDADPGLGVYWDELLREFPNCRVVFVHRPIEECVTSEYEAICDDGNRIFDKVTKASVAKAMSVVSEGMDQLWQHLPLSRKMLVHFHDMDRIHTIRSIWEFCLPDMQFPVERYLILDDLRITQIFSKVIERKNLRINETLLAKLSA